MTVESTDTNTDTDEKTVGEKRYKSLLRVISANTGGKHLPIITRKSAIGLIFNRKKRCNSKCYKNAVNLALNNGHIIIKMGEKEPKYALTVAGSDEIRSIYPYESYNLDAIADVIKEEKASQSPRSDIIEWGKEHIARINAQDH